MTRDHSPILCARVTINVLVESNFAGKNFLGKVLNVLTTFLAAMIAASQ